MESEYSWDEILSQMLHSFFFFFFIPSMLKRDAVLLFNFQVWDDFFFFFGFYWRVITVLCSFQLLYSLSKRLKKKKCPSVLFEMAVDFSILQTKRGYP